MITTAPALVRVLLRFFLGAALVLAGANHFRVPDFYVSIMPPYLPWHLPLVYLSGVAEIVVGAMLFTRWYQLAAWGAIALFMAVFPANVHMAMNAALYPQFSETALWWRLPFQFVLVGWAYYVARR